jgi:hypothetical protein
MSFNVKSRPERAKGLRARDEERLMQVVVERFWEDQPWWFALLSPCTKPISDSGVQIEPFIAFCLLLAYSSQAAYCLPVVCLSRAGH